MNAKSGGGITSNKLVRTPVRTGKPATGINAGYASQIGASQGNHITGNITTAYRGDPMRASAPMSVPLGNALATNVGKGGPDTGRTVMATGSQATHGPVAGTQRATGRDILPEFGPERGGRR